MNFLRDRLSGFLFLLAGLVIGILLAAIVFFSGSNQNSDRITRVPPTVGSPAPVFKLDELDGQPLSLSDLLGKPVVLNFWATWCQPCRNEMPLFQRYADKLVDQVLFVGINQQEAPNIVNQFIDEVGIDFPILLDLDGNIAQIYYVRSYPSTFFIGSDGVLRAQHIGELDEKMLVLYLNTIGIQP